MAFGLLTIAKCLVEGPRFPLFVSIIVEMLIVLNKLSVYENKLLILLNLLMIFVYIFFMLFFAVF